MGLPVVYRKSNEGAIASYDSVDIADGTGVVRYYGANISGANITNRYILTRNSIYADKVFETYTTTGVSNVVGNFQVTFNLPRTLNGTVIANIPLGATTSSGDVNNRLRTQVDVIQTRDSVDTIIGTMSGATISVSTGGSYNWVTNAIPIVCTRTAFKRNDILKCRVTVFVDNYDGGTITIRAPSDPKNRDPDSSDVSEMSYYVPFVIDL